MGSSDRAVTALHVAIATGVLLVVLVGVDAAFGATASLQVETDDGWRTLAQVPEDRDRYAKPSEPLEVNRSEEVTFRVVLDNRRPIGFDEAYRVQGPDSRLAEGRLAAGAFESTEEEFSVQGHTLLGSQPSQDKPVPRPVGGSFQFTLGEETSFGHVELREVAR